MKNKSDSEWKGACVLPLLAAESIEAEPKHCWSVFSGQRRFVNSLR